jgi:hypothetical protein
MDKKIDFLVRELWILAWGASVQRAKLYKKDIGSNSKDINIFRNKIIDYLSSKVIPKYKLGITEDQHYKNIENLITFANNINRGILTEAGYKYGVAQKLLNLILKYHWCLGLIAEPPHCPVDRIVVEKTKHRGKINWTHMTEKSEYERVIEEVKRLAENEGLSIPMWELSIFNRRRTS